MSMRDFNRSTEIMIRSDDVSVGMCINDAKKWVAPDAPDHEILKFLLTCQSAGLNPFLSEAYLINIGGKWGTVIGKYGYLKRAQRHRNQDGELDYNGHECGITIIEQATDARGVPMPGRTRGLPIEIDGKIVPPGHLLVGGWARCWRKGVDRPVKFSASLSEYYKDKSPVWQSMSSTMIVKCALAGAIRETFAIGDSYDDSEIEPTTRRRPTADGRPGPMVVEARVVDQVTTAGGLPQIEALYEDAPDPICPPELVKAIDDLRIRAGKDARWLDGVLMRAGYESVTALTPDAASQLVAKLEGLASRAAVVDAFPDGVGDRVPSAAHKGSVPLDREAVINGAGVAGGDPEDAGDRMRPIDSDTEESPVLVGAGDSRVLPPDGDPED